MAAELTKVCVFGCDDCLTIDYGMGRAILPAYRSNEGTWLWCRECRQPHIHPPNSQTEEHQESQCLQPRSYHSFWGGYYLRIRGDLTEGIISRHQPGIGKLHPRDFAERFVYAEPFEAQVRDALERQSLEVEPDRSLSETRELVSTHMALSIQMGRADGEFYALFGEAHLPEEAAEKCIKSLARAMQSQTPEERASHLRCLAETFESAFSS